MLLNKLPQFNPLLTTAKHTCHITIQRTTASLQQRVLIVWMRLRGHQYKIYVNHSRDVTKYFFAERVVGPWNSLPTDTDFGTLKCFTLSIKSVDFKKFLHHIEC